MSPQFVRKAISFWLLDPSQSGNLADLAEIKARKATAPITVSLVVPEGMRLYLDPNYTERTLAFTFQKDEARVELYAECEHLSDTPRLELALIAPTDSELPTIRWDLSHYFSYKPDLRLYLQPDRNSLLPNGKDEVEVHAILLEQDVGSFTAANDLFMRLLTPPPGTTETVSGIVSPTTIVFPKGASEATFTVKSKNAGQVCIGAAGYKTPSQPEGGLGEPLKITAEYNWTYMFLGGAAALVAGAGIGFLRYGGTRGAADPFNWNECGIQTLESTVGALVWYGVTSIIGWLITTPPEAFSWATIGLGLKDGVAGGLLGVGVIEVIQKQYGNP